MNIKLTTQEIECIVSTLGEFISQNNSQELTQSIYDKLSSYLKAIKETNSTKAEHTLSFIPVTKEDGWETFFLEAVKEALPELDF